MSQSTPTPMDNTAQPPVDEIVCVMGQFVSGSRTSGLYFECLSSLGSALDYARDEVLPGERQLSADEVAEVVRRLDALRERYQATGYQTGMGDELERISDDYFFERELGPVYVLPWDVDGVLNTFGNPLVEEDEDEGHSEPEPAFDPANAEHLEALYRRVEQYNIQ